MSTFAVLGATGQCGGSLIQILSQDPNKKINAYARSKAKFLKQNPGIESDSRFTIFEGNLDDHELIASCISGTDAAFLAVAETENKPGCTIAQETTASVLKALDYLREQDAGCKLPHLIVLSSASLDDIFWRNESPYLHNLALRAFSHVYDDLRIAEKTLRSRSDFVKTTFVKPGGLTHERQKGHELSTQKQKSFLGFLDLAAGMVEIGETREKWEMENVSVLPTADDVRVEPMVPWFLLKGLFFHFFPWAYPYLMGS